MATRKSKATKEHRIYEARVSPEKIARVMRERAVSEAAAKRILRGHGTTPEHGKERPYMFVDRTHHYTKSAQAAERTIAKAAANNQRVSIVVTTRDGATYQAWENRRGGVDRLAGRGISAKFLLNGNLRDGGDFAGIRNSPGNVRDFLANVAVYADRPEDSGTVGFQPAGPQDIVEIDIVVWH